MRHRHLLPPPSRSNFSADSRASERGFIQVFVALVVVILFLVVLVALLGHGCGVGGGGAGDGPGPGASPQSSSPPPPVDAAEPPVVVRSSHATVGVRSTVTSIAVDGEEEATFADVEAACGHLRELRLRYPDLVVREGEVYRGQAAVVARVRACLQETVGATGKASAE